MSNSSAKKRGVIYARVSTEEQKKVGHSLPSQVRHLGEKMKSDGVEAVHPPIEDVESGRNFQREGLKKLLKLAEGGYIDYVYAYDLDRLGRNVAETPYLMYKLKEAGVIVRTMNGEYHFDDPCEYVFVTLKSFFGDIESRKIGERTQRGKNEKFMQGKWVGPTPFGYRKNVRDELEKLPELQPVIVDIFQTYKTLKNIKKLTHTINGRYLDKIGKFSVNQIRRILTNPVYIGRPRYGQNELCAPSLILVAPKVYSEVQCLIENKAKRFKAQEYRKPRSILDDFAAEYGMDYVMRVLDILKPHCPKCKTQMVGNGSKPVKELRLPNFKCPACGYQRTIPSAAELEHFRDGLLSCPRCRSIKNFDIAGTLDGFNKYTCRCCGFSFQARSEGKRGKGKRKR